MDTLAFSGASTLTLQQFPRRIEGIELIDLGLMGDQG